MNRLVVGILAVASCMFSLKAVEVGTAAEFKSAVGTADEIKLTADINLADWTPVDYGGTIDGDGHTVTGLNGSMFVTFSGTVKNLTLDGSVGDANTTIALASRESF